MDAGTKARGRFFSTLAGKTRDEIAQALAELGREDLVDLVFSLVTFDQLLTARQIAEATQVNRRAVLADMKAGRFADPIFGAGFFCLAHNSFRVSATAANAWRRRFFVRVRDRLGADRALVHPIPAKKKNGATADAGQNDVSGESAGQRRAGQLVGSLAEPEAHDA